MSKAWKIALGKFVSDRQLTLMQAKMFKVAFWGEQQKKSNIVLHCMIILSTPKNYDVEWLADKVL